MAKEMKISISLLIVYLVLFSLIAVFRFPQTPKALQQLELDGKISTSDGDYVILDTALIGGKTSVHYLLENNSGGYFIMTARKFPFLPRYGLSRIMPFSNDEIYDSEDYFNEFIIVKEGDSLSFSEKRHTSISVYLMMFLLFATVLNILYTYRKQKK